MERRVIKIGGERVRDAVVLYADADGVQRVGKHLHKLITSELEELGFTVDILPDNPKPVPTIEELKSFKNQNINADRDAWLESKYAEVEYNGVVYDADKQARDNVTALVSFLNSGMALPNGFTFRAKDNTDQPLVAADLVALGALMLQFVNAAYATSWTLKAQVDVATTEQELQAIQWPWPDEEPI